jgi:CubicO group peptidase (beta-lactamase class C family)
MLLDQRSSINDKHYGDLNNINPEKGKKWMECYNDYCPGTKFKYCNFNYNLLGAIIEKVTGRRFFDYIDDNIMKPLELNASYNLTKMDTSMLVRSYRYDKMTKQFKKDGTIYNSNHYRVKLRNYKLGSSTASFSPSGGVKISATDLAKYMMMYMNYGEYNGKRILSKESVLEMWRPQGGDESPNSYFSQYGLSFSRWSKIVDEESFVGITGSAHGVHSVMYFNPEKKYGFIVICNGCNSDVKMKDSVVKVLYKHLIKEKK